MMSSVPAPPFIATLAYRVWAEDVRSAHGDLGSWSPWVRFNRVITSLPKRSKYALIDMIEVELMQDLGLEADDVQVRVVEVEKMGLSMT